MKSIAYILALITAVAALPGGADDSASRRPKTCEVGKYLEHKKCKPCVDKFPNSKACTAHEATECDTTVSFLEHGKCSTACFPSRGVGKHKTVTCIPCKDPQAATCDEHQSLSCKPDSKYNLYKGKCIDQCPHETFEKDKKCNPCISNAKCDGSSTIKCHVGYDLVMRGASTQCVSQGHPSQVFRRTANYLPEFELGGAGQYQNTFKRIHSEQQCAELCPERSVATFFKKEERCLCRSNRGHGPAKHLSGLVTFTKESCSALVAAKIYPAGVCQDVVYRGGKCYVNGTNDFCRTA